MWVSTRSLDLHLDDHLRHEVADLRRARNSAPPVLDFDGEMARASEPRWGMPMDRVAKRAASVPLTTAALAASTETGSD